ncbi:myosin-binding protein 1-like [Cucurbita moschata]|uniref:Myosin-binding protein 1-like n=1 Tax=Cucurbita moschata TaxID=3662 RepID=A0A6J1G417_CUCMO|nr:myosin-binding protein 1-like [Cucurbita moschata]XP_022946504.1 myosin-binding protein 1-like [Cucurbita moschata]
MGTLSVEACTGGSLRTYLLSAVSECLLICMLFLHSIFSFFITKCARLWKLRIPCLLCSRLDHVFGSEKKGYLWTLICGKHKLEVSSLVLCHAHNKLVNVHEMCENCLFSFATINKLNSETYRLLVGKLGEDPHFGIDSDPSLGDQKHCSCCEESYIPRGFVQTLIQTRSSGLKVEDLNVPLSSSIVPCKVDVQGSCCEESYVPRGFVQTSIQTRSSGLKAEDLDVPLSSSIVPCKVDIQGPPSNPLPHVQYKELNITSDTESDGNGGTLVVETANSKDDLALQDDNMEANFSSLASNLTSTTLVEPALAPEPLVLLGDAALPRVERGVSIGHGLDESTPKHVEANDGFSSPNDLLSLDNMVPSSNTIVTSVEAVEESYVTRSEEHETKSRGTEKAEISPTKATSEEDTETQPVSSDTAQMAPNTLELGDAYKIAVGARAGRQLSGKLSEQWIEKDSSKVSDDLKLLMTQLSFNRTTDQSREMSPRLSINGDDVSNIVGMQIPQKRISLERNESSLDSLDGSIVSEIEGENVVDRLKRQVEYDKKLMISLYKELEEERNASAIAANQAMAMITRLQEEKANLHMEALQCLRMMEEQSEYDDDALQKANDLITEKDKEIQDLEAELEFFRINFPNAYTIDNLIEMSVKERDIGVVHLESNQLGTIGYGNLVVGKPDIHEKVGSEGGTFNNLLSEFEDEKINILQCLQKLENMIHLFSINGVKMDLSNGEYLGTDDLKLENGEDHAKDDDDDNDNDDCLPSLANPPFDKESNELDRSDRNSSSNTEREDFAFLRIEVSKLNKRMEVLEADKNILEHTINSLIRGEEGLQFVREIASLLRELRKIGLRS